MCDMATQKSTTVFSTAFQKKKEGNKAPYYWPFIRGIHKGQWCGKCAYIMVSLCCLTDLRDSNTVIDVHITPNTEWLSQSKRLNLGWNRVDQASIPPFSTRLCNWKFLESLIYKLDAHNKWQNIKIHFQRKIHGNNNFEPTNLEHG